MGACLSREEDEAVRRARQQRRERLVAARKATPYPTRQPGAAEEEDVNESPLSEFEEEVELTGFCTPRLNSPVAAKPRATAAADASTDINGHPSGPSGGASAVARGEIGCPLSPTKAAKGRATLLLLLARVPSVSQTRPPPPPHATSTCIVLPPPTSM